jgi:hypothetical protein
MLVRVRDFGMEHKDLFPESSVGGKAFTVVTAAVAEIRSHLMALTTAVQQGKAEKAQAGGGIVAHLDAIARTAKVIGKAVPGFDSKFKLPRRKTDQAIVTVGRAFVAEAAAVKEQFVSHGLTDTFISDLEAQIAVFERAIAGREKGKTGQSVAHVGIADAMKAGFDAARTLDVIVANQLRGDRLLLTAWRRERRVDPPRGKTAAAPSGNSAPATTVSPAGSTVASAGPGAIAPPAASGGAAGEPSKPAAASSSVDAEPAKPAGADTALKVAS